MYDVLESLEREVLQDHRKTDPLMLLNRKGPMFQATVQD